MTVTIDAVYLSSFSSKVHVGAVAALENSSNRQEGDDGTVHVTDRWPRRRRKWQLSWGAPFETEISELIETLWEVNGNQYGFLFIPPRLRDYTAIEQELGEGNGVRVAFQLVRKVATYNLDNDEVRSVSWDILYPLTSDTVPERNDPDTVHVYLDGSEVNESDYTVGPLGLITFDTAPASYEVVTATFQYATPVQWLSESIDTTLINEGLDEIRSATIGEVFL